MKEHKKDIQNRLHELAEIQFQTYSAEQKILESATLRLDQVNADILKLRSIVLADENANKKYHDLILERGRLNQVVANRRGIFEVA